MAAEDVELIRSLVPPPEVDWAAVIRDDAIAEKLEEESRETFSSDFRCGLAGVTLTWRPGFEGLRSLWLEWLEPWDTYHAREERIEDLGDGRVLWVGQDTGTRNDGAGEIVMSSSAIWTVRDGKVAEAVFYADRGHALRDAGFDSAP